MSDITTKMLGDAGEYYAVSQFLFAGHPATKMPEGWTGYDLAVELDGRLESVSIKTRRETEGWKTSAFFTFDDRHPCDWLVCILVGKPGPDGYAGPVQSWIIPLNDAKSHWSAPGEESKIPHLHDLSWSRLTGALAVYENNWRMETGLCATLPGN
jgi:hypothetical protein